MKEIYYILAIQTVLAYEWLVAGFHKITDSSFNGNLINVLNNFASKNEIDWYKNFLLEFVVPHAKTFGYVIAYGEFLAGLGLLLSVCSLIFIHKFKVQKYLHIITIIALIGGAFMSLNFYLAAGWTGASTKSLNVIMFWTQFILILFWIRNINSQKNSRVL